MNNPSDFIEMVASRSHISPWPLPKAAPLFEPAKHHALYAYKWSGLLRSLDFMRRRSAVHPARSGEPVQPGNQLLRGRISQAEA
jgi:hypothetical protein